MIIPEKCQALIDAAMKFVGVHEGSVEDENIIKVFQSIISKPVNQPWCVDFVQYCVREVDKKFNSKTDLFTTESSIILWLKTDHSARVTLPEPGHIMLWQHYRGENPISEGHAGIVREILDSNYVLTCEANTTNADTIDRIGNGVYLKKRRLSVTTGPMRTLGFLKPWAG